MSGRTGVGRKGERMAGRGLSGKSFEEENPVIYTEKGERVRSKSEKNSGGLLIQAWDSL